MRVLILLLIWVSQAVIASEAEVHQLLDRFHASAAGADFDAYFAAFADDGYFLGTDASERWSVSEFKEYAAPAFAAGRGWTYTLVHRNVASRADVYWFDEVLFNTKLGKCRGTGVVVNTPAGLKIAHYSLSMLVPNEIADDVGRQTMRSGNVGKNEVENP